MKLSGLMSIGASLMIAHNTFAHGTHTGGIQSAANQQIASAMDILHAKIEIEGNVANFHMAAVTKAGQHIPTSTGALAGSDVYSYVWPTSLNSSSVGFEPNAGILALAVTSHPDFDDTPLFDENNDGLTDNDGLNWHSHWVVLAPNEKCGKDALGVVDIPEGTTPNLPKTWPGLPILIDSPGWQPIFDDQSVNIKVPFAGDIELVGTKYDGVTAGLRVNQSVHAPLLCVVDVFDVASGNLSLPGVVSEKNSH